ncbi:MAG: DUF1501 domain-containing protein [Planctomycetes bacterium]|nr:DUF1501 domain-containing protein [Planctomycetota bacterium]MCB9824365.1 DUF1501 domain-containing protein [Planctomycetota bacterium]MCB9828588.1 DUF1501 domain-containing protein [Planctomycetota bacterium]MCB9900362.1 DUF1501 domain-containing protein [Planctomycetota bacterium]
MGHPRLPSSPNRRDILRMTLAGAGLTALGGGLSRGLLRHAEGAPITGIKRVVVIFAYGGWDGLNVVIPTSNQAYYDRRPTIQIPSGSALTLNGTSDYGFHPSMDRLQALWNNDATVAAFRRVGYPSENLSHFESQDIYSEGVRNGFGGLPIDPSGWIARVSNDLQFSATGAVAVGVGRPLEVEGADTSPLMVSSLSAFRFQNDQAYTNNHLYRLEVLKQMMQGYSGSTLDTESAQALEQGLDLADQIQAAVSSYSSPYADDYPNNSPGRYLKDIARLIQGGFDSQVFFTGFGGHDTHGDQGAETGTQATLLERLDSAIGAFADDCKDMGVWDDTCVVMLSEFGRRNFENSSQGTDHGHGNQFFATGGSMNGGLYGPDITESDIADRNWMDYELDFRDILRDIVTNHLGGNGNSVFPETQQFNNTLGLFA